MSKPLGVGLIGCGAISGEYLKRARQFPILRVVAAADIKPDVAKAKAAEWGIPKSCSVEELLADPQVEVVLNLTVPKAHGPVALASLDAGKHIYMEKPLAITRADGLAIMAKARDKNLRVGCAPDTFMGSGIQTARHAIDAGRIGRPVAFEAFMMCPGHESWHPSPEFHYQVGGGPMYDMGPYYLTALLNLLGPVKRLCGLATIEIPRRIATSASKYGVVMDVQTPDHVLGLMEFQNGAAGTIVQSFATWHGLNGVLTIHGTEGAIQVPDPNRFDGVVKFRGKDDKDWIDLPPVFSHDYGRAVGLAEMAKAIRSGREFRATGEQGMYVLDLMQGFLDSSEQGRHYQPSTQYLRPQPMPVGKEFGVFA
jgi:predicted dehydrogenase